MVVDELAQQLAGEWRGVSSNLEVCEVVINEQKILLLKPQTFMNASGLVISYLIKKGLKPENILVVHDELEIAFGRVTVRQGGSARGHNGLRSIIEACGPDFWRMRMGIGRPLDGTSVADFVLQNFSEDPGAVSRMIELAIGEIIKLVK